MKALKFSAVWCAPCKMLTARFKQEGINIEEVDVDYNKELAQKYGVRSVPTVVILDPDGNRMESIVGANYTKEQLQRLKNLSL